ncbi:MAG: DUF1045 domain-containing protein [Pseudomonadota bacterium]
MVRYAVYLTPVWESDLADAAARWLGRCAFEGKRTAPLAPPEAAPEVPAQYGFHATMRAPFRLRADQGEAQLLRTFGAFAARQGLVSVPLEVGRLGNFLALVSSDPTPLAAAANAALEAFEPFRAPLSEAERARRNPEKLDERGRELLDRWGYPYVEERFTFHMTLSGPVKGENALKDVEAAAARHFASFVDGTPVELEFALFSQNADEPFRIIATAAETLL